MTLSVPSRTRPGPAWPIAIRPDISRRNPARSTLHEAGSISLPI
jgi:hypothetical protein